MKISDEEKAEHPEAEITGGYLKESYASKKSSGLVGCTARRIKESNKISAEF